MCACFWLTESMRVQSPKRARQACNCTIYIPYIYKYVCVYFYVCFIHIGDETLTHSLISFHSLSLSPEYKRLISNVDIHSDLWMRTIYPNNLTISWNDNIAMILTWHVQDRLQMYIWERMETGWIRKQSNVDFSL